MNTLRWQAAGLAAILCVVPGLAHAQSLEFGGRVQTDVRFRPVPLESGTAWYNKVVLPKGVSRNQNLFKLQTRGEFGAVAGVADVDFLWLGVDNDTVQTFNDLTERNRVDPFRLKLHAAYVEVHDLWLDGLDVRIGQQVVNWGKGDQFNPTNTLNASDLEDPLLFGNQLANSMIRADYAPGGWTFSAVLVPVFKPAVLPPSASLALADLRRIPILQDHIRRELLGYEQTALDNGYPTVVGKVTPVLPDTSFENMQFALRLAGMVGNHDVGVSYYYGRSDIPQPWSNFTQQVTPSNLCNPAQPSDCVRSFLQTDVELRYPRMQVLSLNLAGELPLLAWAGDDVAPFGYHLELGVFFPQLSIIRLYQGNMLLKDPGEFDYGLGGKPPTVVDDTPFAKWNLGVDYTLFGRALISIQWVHGFVDEFGAGDFIHPGYAAVRGVSPEECGDPELCVTETLRRRLGDYLVVGGDARFFSDKLLTRLFVVWDLTGLVKDSYNRRTRTRQRSLVSPFSKEGASAVIFPEITYNAGGGVELSVGALAKLGGDTSKFGDPAAGGTDIWTRARYSY